MQNRRIDSEKQKAGYLSDTDISALLCPALRKLFFAYEIALLYAIF